MPEVVAIPGLLVAAADGAASFGGCHEEKVKMLAKKDWINKGMSFRNMNESLLLHNFNMWAPILHIVDEKIIYEKPER